MPQILTLAQLKTRCQERADFPVNDQFVSDAELGRYIQKSYERLYNLLVAKYENYFIKRANETDFYQYTATGTAGIIAGQANYSFPEDYAKLVRLGLTDAVASRSATPDVEISQLYPCTWKEELMINPKQLRARPTHYILHGRIDLTSTKTPAGVRLVPIPDAVYGIDIVYIPAPPTVGDVSEFVPVAGADFVMGWDEYVVLDVAIKMRDKQESAVEVLIEERQHVFGVIEGTLAPRDAGSPAHVEGAAAGIYDDDDASELLYD